MMTYTRGGSNLREDPDLLRGVLASEAEPKVYPEDTCPFCEREGILTADERCFHRHWADAPESRGNSREYRGRAVR